MRLIGTEQAVIPLAKLTDYLLSPTHSVGRHKAAFFRTLGYTQDNSQVLERGVRAFLTHDAEFVEKTAFGMKYEIRGSLVGPNGRSARVVTAWIVRFDEDFPRFITAYPED